MLKNNLSLIFIIILATVLRFYQLGQNPPSLNWDETAHGYNAYSILKTGRDEYGYRLPLSFRSFDDYKPPIYTYLVVPSIAAFGLNDFAVRFPSAALGVLTVIFTYFMVFELFKNRTIAFLSSLFLAISPWHLQFSRVAFETNSAIFWSVLGTWAFLKGIRAKGLRITAWMSLTAIAFGVNLFMYHNARVFIPIFSIILLFISKDWLLKNKKYLVVPAIIAIIFSAVLIPIIFSISGQLRYKGTTIFADLSPQYKASQLIAQDEQSGQLTVGRILHNRRFVYIPILVENYLSHLKPTYLFFTADMDRHHAPQIGLLYLWDLPFVLAGVYFLIRKKFETKPKIIIFWWFLIAPVASSVTWGVPHALRSEIYLPTYQIFTAIGVYIFYKYVRFKRLYLILTATALFINFAFYLHQYYVHMPIEYSKSWLYGRREAALFSESVKNNYDRIIVSTKIDQSHEFWLYYLKYDPQKYLTEGGTVSGGYLEDKNKFDKYFFKPIDFDKQQKEAKTLFVGLPSEFPSNIKILKIVYYLNGEPAIYIVSS
ncbi:MAG: hypothetical protein UT12_C0007G0042 [Candidatus Curtissbacteria bacterium GW2011_GWC2_38_9]|uniref:Glycosyltransferase RgtA/B/C/D-like domain-containing protein n=3 Tax=Candidatus Curtissiibacteriota TaxID=1752717 RepID=A0A1F5HPZ0_9BACT|nr:MAG: hypothetical protein UT12_C0007G0042 [Candidatus Curtissbacteria bacterium GW2011_GWC2_38_9]KKS04126.1 MAG: hypothetical protein UU56_C0009G0008 [Candidatus Curtissbacteria bacterium GW2011_GWA2_41_24]OGD90111.1 MAG: hypothetical protein A2Z54_00920 [Candidatus Curtissbacteria bacterium RIFCSPHIGHO2_02_39_8]OGE06133.1 MAG: hypothetical protein A2W70_05305 [Candidatus Curtissbacteria bacterium RIFCSPLOWO2_02_41_11]